MPRLTLEEVASIKHNKTMLDKELEQKIGTDVRGLACYATDIPEKNVRFDDIIAGIVPITAGKGVISGFSESVASVLDRVEIKHFITETYDVTGIAEAISKDADIIFMADDRRFIAYNTRAGKYADNVECTARGYVAALELAADGLSKKDVLVVGAGRIGSQAAEILRNMGANVAITDIVPEKAKEVADNLNISYEIDTNKSISDNMIIFNASDEGIPAKHVKDGAVISSPGANTEADNAKVIFDPLDIGVTVMAVTCASFHSNKYTDIRKR